MRDKRKQVMMSNVFHKGYEGQIEANEHEQCLS
jgi:hypothetical protein